MRTSPHPTQRGRARPWPCGDATHTCVARVMCHVSHTPNTHQLHTSIPTPLHLMPRLAHRPHRHRSPAPPPRALSSVRRRASGLARAHYGISFAASGIGHNSGISPWPFRNETIRGSGMGVGHIHTEIPTSGMDSIFHFRRNGRFHFPEWARAAAARTPHIYYMNEGPRPEPRARAETTDQRRRPHAPRRSLFFFQIFIPFILYIYGYIYYIYTHISYIYTYIPALTKWHRQREPAGATRRARR